MRRIVEESSQNVNSNAGIFLAKQILDDIPSFGRFDSCQPSPKSVACQAYANSRIAKAEVALTTRTPSFSPRLPSGEDLPGRIPTVGGLNDVPLRNFTILQFRNHSIPHFHNPTFSHSHNSTFSQFSQFHILTIPQSHNGTISQCYNETTRRARRACSRMPREGAELRLGGHGGGEVRHDLFHTMSLENTRARPSSERMIQYLNPRNSDCGDRSACTRDLVPSVGFMR